MDLALHNLQRLICHKTQTNKHLSIYSFKSGRILFSYLYICLSLFIAFGKYINPLIPKQVNRIYLICMYKEDLAFVKFCYSTVPLP